MKNINDFANEHYACESGERWLDDHEKLHSHPKKMWKKCDNALFLLWVLDAIEIPHKKMVRIQLNLLKKHAHNDPVFKKVVKQVKKWLAGNRSPEKLSALRTQLLSMCEDSMETKPSCSDHFLDLVEYIIFDEGGLACEHDVRLSAKKIRKSIPWKTVKKYYKKNA